MSLERSTQVTCDASDLLMTRLYTDSARDNYADVLRATREERTVKTVGCAFSAPGALNVKIARERASLAGWIRHREKVRKYSGSDQFERRTFDLCPVCAPKVVES